MPAIPPTPFLPSRLGDGYGEESLLMAQEPIFDDQSFAEHTFWTSTPRPDRRPRERSSSEDYQDIIIVNETGSGQEAEINEGIGSHASTSLLGPPMEETELSGRGEKPTWLDEQSSEASSSKSKRGVSSPGNTSESKRARPRSPHCDDYYRRRLSRQSSSTSLHSPSLPTICLASSSSSSISRSRQISSSSYDSQSSMRRASTSSRSLLNVELPQTSDEPESIVAESNSPRPAPTRLSKFLARSAILHPPKLPAVISAQTTSHLDDLPDTEEEPSFNNAPPARPSPTHEHGHDTESEDGDADPAPSLSSISRTSLPPTPSLRKSTSQRVLGFLSDLVRSTSSSVLNISATIDQRDLGSSSTKSAREDVSGGETGGEDDGQMVSARSEEQSFGSGSSHRSHENDRLSSARDHSRTSSGSHNSQRPPSPSTIRQPAGFVPLTKPTKAFISNTASRASNPIRHPFNPSNRSTTNSSFTSAALARLPPSGKGSSSSGERITIKPNERASNLHARRALFERPSNDQPQLQPRPVMKRTIPLSGRTPGKASKARAEARQRSDRVVQDKMEEREQMHVDTERRKREEAEREYAARRKETVIRAKPVPAMFKQRRELSAEDSNLES